MTKIMSIPEKKIYESKEKIISEKNELKPEILENIRKKFFFLIILILLEFGLYKKFHNFS